MERIYLYLFILQLTQLHYVLYQTCLLNDTRAQTRYVCLVRSARMPSSRTKALRLFLQKGKGKGRGPKVIFTRQLGPRRVFDEKNGPRWARWNRNSRDPGVFNHLRLLARAISSSRCAFSVVAFGIGRTNSKGARPTRGLRAASHKENSPFRRLQVYYVTVPFPMEGRFRMAAGRSTLQQSRLPGGDPRVLRFRAKLIPQHCNRQNHVYDAPLHYEILRCLSKEGKKGRQYFFARD